VGKDYLFGGLDKKQKTMEGMHKNRSRL